MAGKKGAFIWREEFLMLGSCLDLMRKGRVALLSLVEWEAVRSVVGTGASEDLNWVRHQRGVLEMEGSTLGR